MSEPPIKIMKIGDYSGHLIEHVRAENIIELLRITFPGSHSSGPINPTERNLAQIFAEQIRKLEKYFVSLCQDVLFEVFCYGERRRLTKLEYVGRRFHLLAENFFSERPFLRLNLEYNLRNGLNGLDTKIWARLTHLTRISHTKLATFPQFLRLNTLELFHTGGSYGRLFIEKRTDPQTIAKNCQLLVKHLKPLKRALKDPNLICFFGVVNQKVANVFEDHIQLVAHLRDDIFPICNLSRRYKFNINFYSDENAAKTITSILEFVRGPNVEIKLCLFFIPTNPIKLPVDSIAKWLHQKNDRIGMINQKEENKFLRIEMNGIQNGFEMCGHLMEAFKEAIVPSTTYIFKLKSYGEFRELEGQILTNKKTNEELSLIVSHFSNELEIKRTVKK